MVNKWTKSVTIAVIFVLVMSVGAIAVFAQADDTETPDDNPVMPFRHGFHGWGGDRLAYLAEALGITTAELEAAQQQAHANQIAQAVEDGLITAEQGELMLAMQALKGYIDRDALLAAALDISVDALQEAKENGTLQDLLANITPADLQENMQNAYEGALAQAVADQVITQDQADLLLEQGSMRFGGFGHFGGHRGHGGFGGRGGFPGGFGSGINNGAPSVTGPSA